MLSSRKKGPSSVQKVMPQLCRYSAFLSLAFSLVSYSMWMWMWVTTVGVAVVLLESKVRANGQTPYRVQWALKLLRLFLQSMLGMHFCMFMAKIR